MNGTERRPPHSMTPVHPILWLYRIMGAGAAAVGAIAGAFFIIGLGDGSVSAFNIRLWLLLLAGIALVLGGGAWLRARGWTAAAALLLAVLALPGVLYALFILVVIASGARWN